jgi:hemolysin III
MGWAIVVAIKLLIVSVAAGGIVFLVLGGLAYSVGILFYRWKKLKYHHAVWHLFVLTGSILHFFAVLFYVIPILE